MAAPDKFHLGEGMVLRKVKIGDLKEQDVNAHYMPSGVFNRLTENISDRGALESIPLTARPDPEGPIEVVSGHHRIRAARAAGHDEVWVLVDTLLRTRSEIVAKQLAHNALVGRDDAGVIAEMLKEIDNPDDLLKTGLTDQVPNVDPDDFPMFVPNIDLRWKRVTFEFLPHQLENFTELLESLDGAHDFYGVASEEQFKPFLEAAAEFARVKDVRSIGTAIALLTELGRQIADGEGGE